MDTWVKPKVGTYSAQVLETSTGGCPFQTAQEVLGAVTPAKHLTLLQLQHESLLFSSTQMLRREGGLHVFLPCPALPCPGSSPLRLILNKATIWHNFPNYLKPCNTVLSSKVSMPTTKLLSGFGAMGQVHSSSPWSQATHAWRTPWSCNQGLGDLYGVSARKSTWP